MPRLSLAAFAAFTLAAVSASAQSFDNSANAQLNGAYFVREVTVAGQTTTGAITTAASATGTLTFDGKGGYSFTGQVTVSTGGPVSQTFSGQYKLAPNGFFAMSSLTDANDLCFGTSTSAIGPNAIIASATEGTNVDMLIAIPVGSGLTNSSLSGPYAGGYIDFTSASTAMTRQASFTLNANAGSFGTVGATGKAVNLGGNQITQNVTGVTYSLTSNGSGSVNFGALTPTQLVSGTKNFYVSSDGNILLGGNPAGFDMLVAVKGFSGTASNTTATGLYFTGGLEDFADSSGQFIQGFYGSSNANGKGTTLAHKRLQTFSDGVYDYTFDSEYTVQSNGTIAPNDVPYSFTFGANGKSFIAVGNPGLYALQVGFGAPTYSGTGVFVNPTGIVNAATFAPITNPIAPNEIVTLFGSGLASGLVSATSLPLPTILSGVQVTVNGTPAALFYVSATQIAFLIPPTIDPTSVAQATIQVTNNNAKSNSVTVYTNYTSPGILSATANGIGPALATHADLTTLITAAKPASVGETVVFYGVGLGGTSPTVANGAPSPSNPPATVTDTSDVLDFGGTAGSIKFNGLTPGLSGLYQINVAPATGTPNGKDYVNLATPDAYTSQVTTSISGGSNASVVLGPQTKQPVAARPHPLQTSRLKPQGIAERGR